ncbi:MAG: diaminopimelate epimerase [Candidatus Omnitrophica bacterium]|nr:diaminopimelate epimerase [Candidatus Omnitrophota bacterium]
MKTIKFIKMAGAGNDFLIIDAPKEKINLKRLAIKACDRTNGIGADGLIIFDKSATADFRMRIINADGSEAEMCGNGARCMAAYIVRHKKPRAKTFSLETLAGQLEAKAAGEIADVRLSDPTDYRPDISIEINNRDLTMHYIDTGVPHVIIPVQGLADFDVPAIGRQIRFHEEFMPRGTNVNFVEVLQQDLVDCRTYERGVEDETKACGTGSVAAAIVSYLQLYPGIINKNGARMRVRTHSGEILQVRFDINDCTVSNVHLKGSAKFIARGEYYYS